MLPLYPQVTKPHQERQLNLCNTRGFQNKANLEQSRKILKQFAFSCLRKKKKLKCWCVCDCLAANQWCAPLLGLEGPTHGLEPTQLGDSRALSACIRSYMVSPMKSQIQKQTLSLRDKVQICHSPWRTENPKINGWITPILICRCLICNRLSIDRLLYLLKHFGCPRGKAQWSSNCIFWCEKRFFKKPKPRQLMGCELLLPPGTCLSIHLVTILLCYTFLQQQQCIAGSSTGMQRCAHICGTVYVCRQGDGLPWR